MHLHSNKYILLTREYIHDVEERFSNKTPVHTAFRFSLLFPVVLPPLPINGKGLQCLAEISQTAEQGW